MIIDIEKLRLEKHFISKSAPYVDQLIDPLKKYGIDHLTIGIIRDNDHYNGTLEIITSNPALMETYVREKFYKDIIGGGASEYVSCNVLTSSLAEECPVMRDFYKAIRDEHHLANSIDLVRKFENHCEIFYFAAEEKNQAIENFYLNNINFLDSFILSFREKAEKIYQESYKNRLYCPDSTDNTLLVSSDWQKKTFSLNVGGSIY